MASDSLSVTDNRTGKQYELPIAEGAVRAADLRQIKTSDDDFGLMSYDPSLLNTASVRSSVTYIDGDAGILRYRGYPIEQLAEHSTYMEIVYLLLNGELPTPAQLLSFESDIRYRTMVLEAVREQMETYRYDAHPMGMLLGTMGTMSTYYPESRNITDPDSRRVQTVRAIGKVATVAAWCYRHTLSYPFIYPDNDLTYTGNFLNMLFRMVEPKYVPNPAIERAIDVLFILHADHEQNASANAMRAIASSQADPFSALAGAIGSLSGPLHGGANEAVIRMLQQIGSIIKTMADQVFEVTGVNPLLEIALELERIALQDDFFVSRQLYPNVDFYSGLIYQAMGFPVEMFPVLFAVPRTAGWMAQWNEGIVDREQRIVRPRQLYIGADKRDYVPINQRS